MTMRQQADEISIEHMSMALGLSYPTVWRMVENGKLQSRIIGKRRRVIPCSELRRLSPEPLVAVPAKHKRQPFNQFEIKPGGLSDADRDMIFDMALDGMLAWSIGRKIKKHPSTVSWFLLQNGLKKNSQRPKQPFDRAGVRIIPYSAEEDAFILDLRGQGLSPGKISLRYHERFENVRSRKSISFRLTMLASNELMLEEAV